jgi:hypothetical protein
VSALEAVVTALRGPEVGPLGHCLMANTLQFCRGTLKKIAELNVSLKK